MLLILIVILILFWGGGLAYGVGSLIHLIWLAVIVLVIYELVVRSRRGSL